MRRDINGCVILDESEAEAIADFIERALERMWDRHTDHYICSDSLEEGMRRMDPEAYLLLQQLRNA